MSLFLNMNETGSFSWWSLLPPPLLPDTCLLSPSSLHVHLQTDTRPRTTSLFRAARRSSSCNMREHHKQTHVRPVGGATCWGVPRRWCRKGGQCVANQVFPARGGRWCRKADGVRRGWGRGGGGEGRRREEVTSERLRFRLSERIMADGPRCKRRKQANPKRSSGKSQLLRRRFWELRAGRRSRASSVNSSRRVCGSELGTFRGVCADSPRPRVVVDRYTWLAPPPSGAWGPPGGVDRYPPAIITRGALPPLLRGSSSTLFLSIFVSPLFGHFPTQSNSWRQVAGLSHNNVARSAQFVVLLSGWIFFFFSGRGFCCGISFPHSAPDASASLSRSE